MPAFKEYNAVTHCIDQMREQWLDATNSSDARIIRWLVHANEISMVDAFWDNESLEQKNSYNSLIRLNAPFIDHESYGFDLIQYLQDELNKDVTENEESLPKLEWRAAGINKDDDNVEYFIAQTSAFIRALNIDESEKLILFIAPQLLTGIEDWQLWWMNLAQAQLPKHLMVMVVDYAKKPLLEDAAMDFKHVITTIEPEIDVYETLDKLIAEGNPADPEVEIRKHIMAATEALSLKKYGKINKEIKVAKKIAVKYNWSHYIIIIHLLTGGMHFTKKKYGSSIKSFKKALKTAEFMIKEGKEEGTFYRVQGLNNLASAYMADKQYEKAIKTGSKAVKVALRNDMPFLVMNAHQIKAKAYSLSGDYYESWESLNDVLEVADKVDEKILAGSTLPSSGVELIELANDLGFRDRIDSIDKRMAELIGPDWKEKAEQSHIHSHSA